MFSGLGLDYLKKKLFTARKSEEGSSKDAIRTIEIELASTTGPAPAQSIPVQPAVKQGKSRNMFINVAPRKTETILSTETIAERAYEIWNREGCPNGKDLEHWLSAENELRSQH
jgi:hypothetical protein